MKRVGMEHRVVLNGERPGRIMDAGLFKGVEIIMSKAEAVEILEYARGKTPADWISWMHLGTARHICGDTMGGLKAAQKALAMYRCGTTLLNVAVILETLGRFDEALELSTEAQELEPENQFAGLLWAQGLLRQGRWAEGWEPFEWYSWGTIWESELTQYIPHWEGQDLEGKSILVLQGGGFGDNLMFFRWFYNLCEAGARITYACPEFMVPLLEGHPWVDKLLPVHEEEGDLPEVDLDITKDGVRQYDYFVPIMGLARRFNATLPLPWDGPYIKPKYTLRAPHLRKKVGVCWMGAEKLDPRRHRSLNLLQARRLLSITDVQWINLQYGVTPPVTGDHVTIPVIKDWSDTAAIIACCDLVVTVDTGVMHLAGAMGKPTWVMLPGLSDWKFLLGSNTMPFYPSVRLFRNGGEGLNSALEDCIRALMV